MSLGRLDLESAVVYPIHRYKPWKDVAQSGVGRGKPKKKRRDGDMMSVLYVTRK
jgi:hypothetical protein